MTEHILYAWARSTARESIRRLGLTAGDAAATDQLERRPLVFDDPIAAWSAAGLFAGVGEAWDLWGVLVPVARDDVDDRDTDLELAGFLEATDGDGWIVPLAPRPALLIATREVTTRERAWLTAVPGAVRSMDLAEPRPVVSVA